MRSEETRIQCLRRFGDDILDLNEVVALVGRHVYLRDGREMGVIAYGDVYEDAAASKYYVIKKRNLVVLRKRPGRNSYLISGYKKGDPHKVKAIRDRCTLVEEGE